MQRRMYFNRRKSLKINTSGMYFRLFVKVIIIILCAYISLKCLNIITNNKTKEVTLTAISSTSKIIAKEIIGNRSIMNQYQIFLENNTTLSEQAKKQALNKIVSEYMKYSEYTYNTEDPGYEQVVNLIYEKTNEEETTVPETTKKKKENKRETKVKKASGKVMVPMPKIKGKLYTASNIGTFDSIKSKYYIVTAATTLTENDLPLQKALTEKFKIKGNSKKPQILIYHTHSQEDFSNSNGNEATTIIGVGDRLCKVLKEQFGYNVIHDKSTYDIVNGSLDRNEAYDQSREGVKKILNKYPSISLILDIHRDGVSQNTRLLTEVNGKSTAQVMFFNGMSRFKNTGNIDYLYNPYLYENLALTLQMKINAEAYYPGFARHNYVNAYKYNLDLCRQSMLIEVGAQTNTYQEAVNAAEPLARLIDIVMGK